MGFDIDLNAMLQNIERLGNNAESAEDEALEEGSEILRQSMENNINISSDNRHAKDFIIKTEIKKEGMVGEKYILVGPSNINNEEFYYSKMLEFGTVKMSPKPWCEPSILETKESVKRRMADVLRRYIT